MFVFDALETYIANFKFNIKLQVLCHFILPLAMLDCPFVILNIILIYESVTI